MYKFKHLLIAFLTIGVFNACVDDDFEIPKAVCNDGDMPTIKTVQDIFSSSSTTATQYTGDDAIVGYVTSNDQAGNFYKSISFQTETGDLGFSVPIDQTDLYTIYNPGRKVYIKLKDLYTQISHDGLEIGALYEGEVGRIDINQFTNYIIPSCDDPLLENDMVKTVTIDQISDAHINTLIELSGVQFEDAAIGSTYYDADNVLGGATNWDVMDVSGNALIFRTSEYADFAGVSIPEGNGTIRGVLTKYNSDYQLIARSTADVNLDGDRKRIGFAENITGNKKTIAEVRALFTGSDTNVSEDIYIEGLVTMSGIDEDNLSNRNAFIQDDSGAIALRFSSANTLSRGFKVKMNLNGALLSEYNGLLQISNITQATDVEFVSEGNADPTPVVVTIAELLTGNYESQVVQIDAVQFENETGTYGGSQNITDCTDKVAVYTTTYSSFKDDTYPTGNGTIYGIASEFNSAQLLLRDTNDTAGMTDDRCQPATGNTLISGLYFSEYAEGTSNNKYLEIYNGTTETIDLSGYAYPSASNGADVTGTYDFWNDFASGATIAPGGVYIIAHPSANASILAKANETYTYLSNGDDGFALVKGTQSSYVIIDMIGDWGPDPGDGWDVAGVTLATKDHTLVRKASITQSNPNWDSSRGTNVDDSEWVVKDVDDWTSLGSR
ncbi:MAG: DUF5689 domain-containing protein [Flavobacteriaceae bacterium]